MSDTSMPWVKVFKRDILDDPRLGMLPEPAQWRYIQLYVFAGECNAAGSLSHNGAPLDEKDIAWRLHVSVTTLARDIKQLTEKGLLAFDQGACVVVGWEERQRYTDRYYGETKDDWIRLKHLIFKRDGHRCVYCAAPAEHVDHLLARVDGGGNEQSNLVTSCRSCNLSKGRHEWRAWYTRQSQCTPARVAYIESVLGSK